jgi:hypothetical protein
MLKKYTVEITAIETIKDIEAENKEQAQQIAHRAFTEDFMAEECEFSFFVREQEQC